MCSVDSKCFRLISHEKRLALILIHTDQFGTLCNIIVDIELFAEEFCRAAKRWPQKHAAANHRREKAAACTPKVKNGN